MEARTRWLVVLFSMAMCATLAPAAASSAQTEPESASPSRSARPGGELVTLEGFVLAPDGSPAEGTVVTSSAGGRAVTDWAGRYRLEVEVPHAATNMMVTASNRTGGDLVASASVALDGASRSIRVEPLALSLTCSPSWIPTFGSPPGTSSGTVALAVYEDGNGPALYAGGTFTVAGGVAANGIAKWDGASWSPLGSGINDIIWSLAVHDEGGGQALYAGGAFTTAGGVAASRIAKWDGSSWSPLGSGMSGGPNASAVRALAVYDDGGGPALYAGGYFTTAGGVAASRIAKWDGASWSALGSGVFGLGSDFVSALGVYDDGGGPALYAGGRFARAGSVGAARIAKWDGSSWSALGGGMNHDVYALAVHDDGGGPALYAGGAFTTAGGVTVKHIARWNGSSWSALGSGMSNSVFALAEYDDGSGPALYAGGAFTTAGGVVASRIAKWDGANWSALRSGVDENGVLALAEYDDGSGPALYAGGGFTTAGAKLANGIAKWDGASWSVLGSENAMTGDVLSLAVHDDGGGPAIYAGGSFTTAGLVAASRIAKWDGSGWSALGSGMDGGPQGADVHALAVYDDGGGPALYAGGFFISAGGVSANRIAKWDGAAWSAVGGGMSAVVRALVVHDDGSGPALYAGGAFTTAGGVSANRVARWNGASWSALGSGMNDTVRALAVYDDGTGPALYAGGRFTIAGGVAPVGGIAKWDGASWSPLDEGTDSGVVQALAVYDDGSGPALYAGGIFTSATGVAANQIAKWDGASWSALGGGLNSHVFALASHDDGGGPALYAGGWFTAADGVTANRIAKWDGASWSPLGSGMNRHVLALVAYDDGLGPALYAGGNFDSAFDSGDRFLAKWWRDTTPPTLSCPSSVFVLERFGSPPGEVVNFSATANDETAPSPAVVCTPPSGSVFPPGTTLVTCTATDSCGNESTRQFTVTVAPKARVR